MHQYHDERRQSSNGTWQLIGIVILVVVGLIIYGLYQASHAINLDLGTGSWCILSTIALFALYGFGWYAHRKEWQPFSPWQLLPVLALLVYLTWIPAYDHWAGRDVLPPAFDPSDAGDDRTWSGHIPLWDARYFIVGVSLAILSTYWWIPKLRE